MVVQITRKTVLERIKFLTEFVPSLQIATCGNSPAGSRPGCQRKGASLLSSRYHTFTNHEFQVALQKHFKAKRDHVLSRLKKLHLEVDIPPSSTFYIWLNLEKLPPPLNNGLV